MGGVVGGLPVGQGSRVLRARHLVAKYAHHPGREEWMRKGGREVISQSPSSNATKGSVHFGPNKTQESHAHLGSGARTCVPLLL